MYEDSNKKLSSNIFSLSKIYSENETAMMTNRAEAERSLTRQVSFELEKNVHKSIFYDTIG